MIIYWGRRFVSSAAAGVSGRRSAPDATATCPGHNGPVPYVPGPSARWEPALPVCSILLRSPGHGCRSSTHFRSTDCSTVSSTRMSGATHVFSVSWREGPCDACGGCRKLSFRFRCTDAGSGQGDSIRPRKLPLSSAARAECRSGGRFVSGAGTHPRSGRCPRQRDASCWPGHSTVPNVPRPEWPSSTIF